MPGSAAFQPSAIHAMTTAAPVTRPATAPAPVIRSHVSERMISGPKAAPKPAQALETRPSTWLSGSLAMMIAAIATSATQMRPTLTLSRSDAWRRKNSL